VSSTIEEDFELELRSLPGVVSVGIAHRDDGDVASVVLTTRNHDPETVRESAVQVSSLYFPDAVVILEEASEARPDRGGVAAAARIVLDAADFNELDGVSEVHLTFGGRVGVGRAGSGPLIGGAEATLSALRDLGDVIPFYLMGVTKVNTVIALAGDDLLAASKATLDALNRYLSLDPERRQAAAAGEIESGGGEGRQYPE
jgi:NADH dehydrogenase/NADH:ubiquinone oxidoreductase subunit G